MSETQTSNPIIEVLVLEAARQAIESAQSVIGQCDCMFSVDGTVNGEPDARRQWVTARDAFYEVLALYRQP